MEMFLSVTGFGDVHETHFESGIVLAREYFSGNNLDFLKCYEAFEKNDKSELGLHWLNAERKANLALFAFNLQDNSMLELEVSDYLLKN